MTRGALAVLLADALVLPAGFLTTIYLARALGPDLYGVLTLSVGVLMWCEWTVISLFSQLTVKYIAQTDDWRPAGGALLRIHLAAGALLGVSFFLAAPLMAWLLDEPRLAAPLRILALDLPLFCLALVHRNTLGGLGRFSERAAVSASRYVVKLALSVGLVMLGMSLSGAAWAFVGASLAELALGRFFVRPPLLDRTPNPVPGLMDYVAPLFFGAISMRLFTNLDLFALKLLGASSVQAGHYGAAQGVANVPGFLSLAVSTVVVSTVTREIRAERPEAAERHVVGALRFVIALLPFAALVAVSRHDVTRLVFGAKYDPAAAPLAWLTFAALLRVFVQICLSLLTAAGRPRWNLWLSGPLIPLSCVLYALTIPAFGMTGAAAVQTGLALMAGVVGMVVLRRLWPLGRLRGTLVRSLAVSGAAAAAAAVIPLHGHWIVLELALLGTLIPLAYIALGEFREGELSALRAELLKRKKRS